MTDTSWYPGNYRPAPQYPPHYSTMPAYLRIVDTILPTLEHNAKQREFWAIARSNGLAEWQDATGLQLRYSRLRGADKPNRVTLAWMTPQEVVDSNNLAAWHQFNEDGSDWIHLNRTKFVGYFLARNRAPLVYIVAHEFGHSLGFGHGGTGIMDQTPDHAHVNTEEAEVTRGYWGLP